MKLLTPPSGNPKTAKGLAHGYAPFILHLAAAKSSGYQVCPMASKGCTAVCLMYQGRAGVFSAIGKARVRKTKWFFEDRDAFMNQLIMEVRAAKRWCAKRGLQLCVRLNGTSDIRWETIKTMGATIFERFPEVQFYDYTKIANRKHLPKNYHLTFSRSESNDMDVMRAVRNRMNVAIVFRDVATIERYKRTGYHGLAGNWWRQVIDGDHHDMRFLDPTPSVIALKAKGTSKRDTSGFVVD